MSLRLLLIVTVVTVCAIATAGFGALGMWTIVREVRDAKQETANRALRSAKSQYEREVRDLLRRVGESSQSIHLGGSDVGVQLTRLTVATDGDDVVLSVWNEGAGFSSEEREQLFEKFSRLKNASTRGKRGSGLGLYLVRQVTELHGGSAWAESAPGEWARFSLRLARRQLCSEQAESDQSRPQSA